MQHGYFIFKYVQFSKFYMLHDLKKKKKKKTEKNKA